MLTHGTDGKHKTKANHMLRGAGYRAKRAYGGGFSEASKSTPATKGEVIKAVHEHETQEHGGKHSKLKLKDGGCATGGKPESRPDKKPRLAKGGKSPHTKINIMVAPGKGDAAPMPTAGAAIPPPQMPPRPPMAPGVAPPMMAPGMRPPTMKTGGKLKSGGKAVDGKIGKYTAGAGSGEGREEKTANQKKYKKG